MTAFTPVPARHAADMLEAAGVPEARRVLLDAAAAGLVNTYAQVTETADEAGRRCVRDAAVSAPVLRRIVVEGVSNDVWHGGTVRLAASDLKGGAPEIHITGIGFGDKHLKRLIASHLGPAAKSQRQPAPAPAPQPAALQASPAPATSTAPTPARPAGLSAIPPGAVTVTVNQAIAATGLGRTTINKHMGEGTLERAKVGGRTLVTVASLHALLGISN